ncbi:hypothetical protein Pyn_36091 [Prunus yedoensis var. nudiflora]|uniref:Uncharacterized protein n=1 Tax=Prunus yedoensis var. nudiflora TaxID=2094558 RepID=A0A314U8T5_PRUYE|nr:hypothetical protein Pyn_36091 [Prunus yedoensis var. nudiflora]
MSTSMEEIQSYRCRVCFTCIALPEDQISSILKGKHRVFVKCFNITVGDSSLYQNPDFSIFGAELSTVLRAVLRWGTRLCSWRFPVLKVQR